MDGPAGYYTCTHFQGSRLPWGFQLIAVPRDHGRLATYQIHEAAEDAAAEMSYTAVLAYIRGLKEVAIVDKVTRDQYISFLLENRSRISPTVQASLDRGGSQVDGALFPSAARGHVLRHGARTWVYH